MSLFIYRGWLVDLSNPYEVKTSDIPGYWGKV